MDCHHFWIGAASLIWLHGLFLEPVLHVPGKLAGQFVLSDRRIPEACSRLYGLSIILMF
jgi:hypothetical protein